MNPAVDYADAVRRVENKLAAEVDFEPGNHTFLLTHGSRTAKAIVLVHGYPSSPAPFKDFAARFHQRGYNVLAMTLPYHGLADRMNTEHAKLRAEDFMRYADEVVDIAGGLGASVTMAGLSCGGRASCDRSWGGGYAGRKMCRSTGSRGPRARSRHHQRR
jgi:carboxylesterase